MFSKLGVALAAACIISAVGCFFAGMEAEKYVQVRQCVYAPYVDAHENLKWVNYE